MVQRRILWLTTLKIQCDQKEVQSLTLTYILIPEHGESSLNLQMVGWNALTKLLLETYLNSKELFRFNLNLKHLIFEISQVDL